VDKIAEVKSDREELLSDDALLEKFARENYLMKKPTEDIYVIVENDKD
jgi:cell division protein DivIC